MTIPQVIPFFSAAANFAGSMERPALQSLLADIQGGRIDIVVVYKVDRLT
jgi:DNA invertase Pin-like site-specific DNA recombinase